jgi:hypothetical protein
VRGSADEEIDAAGLLALPGVVDAHVHFNDPGRADWEGWTSGSRAAAAGGVTTVIDMPLNSVPPVLDGAAFDLKRAAGERASLVDFALWGGLVGTDPAPLRELAARRHSGPSARSRSGPRLRGRSRLPQPAPRGIFTASAASSVPRRSDELVRRAGRALDEVLRQAREHRRLVHDCAAHHLGMPQDEVERRERPAAAAEHDRRRVAGGLEQPGGIVRLFRGGGLHPARRPRAARPPATVVAVAVLALERPGSRRCVAERLDGRPPRAHRPA